MRVKRIENHGKGVYKARVAYRGRRRAAFRATKEAAHEAESDLLRDLKAEAAEVEQEGAEPATLRQLLGERDCPCRRATHARAARQAGDPDRRGGHLRFPPGPH